MCVKDVYACVGVCVWCVFECTLKKLPLLHLVAAYHPKPAMVVLDPCPNAQDKEEKKKKKPVAFRGKPHFKKKPVVCCPKISTKLLAASHTSRWPKTCLEQGCLSHVALRPSSIAAIVSICPAWCAAIVSICSVGFRQPDKDAGYSSWSSWKHHTRIHRKCGIERKIHRTKPKWTVRGVFL